MTTKIKICGLTRAQDIQTANALQLDYIGFVFAPKSKRFVPPEQAKQLRRQLAPGIRAVGVFVNAPPEQIAALLADGTIDIAQLHGQEDAACIARLRSLTHTHIWQAFRIESTEDISRANASPADLVLLDHGAGGTGERFDWALLHGMARPFVLAGGLTSQNAAEAIAQAHPYAVDTSSGCETNGVKDPARMLAFVNAIRNVKTD